MDCPEKLWFPHQFPHQWKYFAQFRAWGLEQPDLVKAVPAPGGGLDYMVFTGAFHNRPFCQGLLN